MSCLAALLVSSLAIVQADDANVKSLIAQLQGSDTAKAVVAATALADLGPQASAAAPALVKALEAKDEDLRLNAALALGRIGAAAVKPLLPSLASKDSEVRYYAVWALGWVGPDAKDAAPKVIALLADKDENVRRKAAFTLGRIKPQPATAVAALVTALGDESADVKKAAVEALSTFGSDAVPALSVAVKAKDEKVRLEAIRTLGQFGADAKAAVPELKNALLQDGQDNLSREAAHALGRIGKDALPALSDALTRGNADVRVWVFEAYRESDAGVGAMIDALGHAEASIRRQAADALGQLKLVDQSIVAALADGIQDEDRHVRIECLKVLQHLSFVADLGNLAATKVLAAVEHADGQTRHAALEALTVIRGDPDAVLAAMKKALQSADVGTRSGAVRVAATYRKSASVLLEALKDTDAEVRREALVKLADLPGKSQHLVEALRELTKEPERVVMPLSLDKLNWRAIVVAVLASFCGGILWYMPLFSRTMMQRLGYCQDKIKELLSKRRLLIFFTTMIVCYLVVAFVEALLITNLFAASNPLGGAVVGSFLWLGFAGAIALTGHVSSDRPWGIYLIDTMYQLFYLMMIGAIVGGWR